MLDICDITNLSHVCDRSQLLSIKLDVCDYCQVELPIGEMVYLSLGDVYFSADGEEVRVNNMNILACSVDCLVQKLTEYLEDR